MTQIHCLHDLLSVCGCVSNCVLIDMWQQLTSGRGAVETASVVLLVSAHKVLVKMKLTLSSFYILETKTSDCVIQMVLSNLKSPNVDIESAVLF